MLGDLQGLDGHLTTGLDSLYRIFNPVSALDDRLEILPVLAERVELSPDAKQLKLTLRKGVTFHTGRELTSEDLVWNYTRLKDPKVNPIYANLTRPFASFETPDKYTAVIQFDAPNPFVGDALQIMNIIDRETFESAGPTKPVGTGPFVFGEYLQGNRLRLVKNKSYWDTGKPYVDELDVRIFNDPQALISGLEGGALDVAIQPTLVDTLRVQREQKHQVLINPNSGLYMGVAFNTTQPPTDNKLVRQALNYALDRKRIVETVWLGVDKPLAILWYPSSPAYDAANNEAYAFDLDKAKALLDQAGVSPLALDYNYPTTSPEQGLVGQIWQADLARIGVTMTLKSTEPVALNSAMVAVRYQGVGIGTGFFGQLHGGVAWTSPYYGPVNNRSGFKDDRYTALTLALYTEVGAAKQKQAAVAWNEYVLENVHVTAVATQSPRAVAQTNVRGLAYNTGGNFLDLTAAWLA